MQKPERAENMLKQSTAMVLPGIMIADINSCDLYAANSAFGVQVQLLYYSDRFSCYTHDVLKQLVISSALFHRFGFLKQALRFNSKSHFLR